MSALGLIIVGGMLGFIFGYATALLMCVAKKTDEEGEEELSFDGRREDI